DFPNRTVRVSTDRGGVAQSAHFDLERLANPTVGKGPALVHLFASRWTRPSRARTSRWSLMMLSQSVLRRGASAAHHSRARAAVSATASDAAVMVEAGAFILPALGRRRAATQPENGTGRHR